MHCRFHLDIVIAHVSVVFQLHASKNDSLLIRWDTLFVLNHLFEFSNSCFHRISMDCNSFASESRYKKVYFSCTISSSIESNFDELGLTRRFFHNFLMSNKGRCLGQDLICDREWDDFLSIILNKCLFLLLVILSTYSLAILCLKVVNFKIMLLLQYFQVLKHSLMDDSVASSSLNHSCKVLSCHAIGFKDLDAVSVSFHSCR